MVNTEIKGNTYEGTKVASSSPNYLDFHKKYE